MVFSSWHGGLHPLLIAADDESSLTPLSNDPLFAINYLFSKKFGAGLVSVRLLERRHVVAVHKFGVVWSLNSSGAQEPLGLGCVADNVGKVCFGGRGILGQMKIVKIKDMLIGEGTYRDLKKRGGGGGGGGRSGAALGSNNSTGLAYENNAM
jgi:hypothetical protein